jgi:hypothetical protein
LRIAHAVANRVLVLEVEPYPVFAAGLKGDGHGWPPFG